VTYLVTLGDAVNWGQGLLREHKFSDILFRELLKTHPGLEHHRLAHSGAIIGAGAFLVRQKSDGEVPIGYPTILDQVHNFSGDPLDAAAVLVNGGINDVDIRNILSPWVPLATLHDLTIEHCFDSMRLLLRAVCERFANPATPIVVTPYYPVLSRFSNPAGIPLMLANEGLAPPLAVDTTVGRHAVIERCTQFWENSHDFFLAAINDVNASLPHSRVHFADPGFTEHNAAFADDPWLFGLRRDGSAEDEVVEQRVVSCNAAIQVVDTLARQQCYCASAGHPNRAGARRYADAILSVLGLG
jgi:lysophospholipase L1-like esterase